MYTTKGHAKTLALTILKVFSIVVIIQNLVSGMRLESARVKNDDQGNHNEVTKSSQRCKTFGKVPQRSEVLLAEFFY